MRKVKILADSSANLLKLEQMICQGLEFREICEKIEAYKRNTGLVKGKVHLAHCRNLPAAEKLKALILDAYPNLRGMYDENDGNTQVFYFRNAVATFFSFTAAPETVTF